MHFLKTRVTRSQRSLISLGHCASSLIALVIHSGRNLWLQPDMEMPLLSVASCCINCPFPLSFPKWNRLKQANVLGGRIRNSENHFGGSSHGGKREELWWWKKREKHLKDKEHMYVWIEVVLEPSSEVPLIPPRLEACVWFILWTTTRTWFTVSDLQRIRIRAFKFSKKHFFFFCLFPDLPLPW